MHPGYAFERVDAPRVLIGYDGSEAARRALARVARFMPNATIAIVTVAEPVYRASTSSAAAASYSLERPSRSTRLNARDSHRTCASSPRCSRSSRATSATGPYASARGRPQPRRRRRDLGRRRGARFSLRRGRDERADGRHRPDGLRRDGARRGSCSGSGRNRSTQGAAPTEGRPAVQLATLAANAVQPNPVMLRGGRCARLRA